MNRRDIQKLVWVAVITLGLLLAAFAVWFFLFQYNFETYTQARQKFSIKYPTDWYKQENQEGASVIFLSPLDNQLDFFKENVNVVVQDLSKSSMELKDYTDTAIRQVEIIFRENLQVIESKPTWLSGYPAHRFIFLGKGPEAEFKYFIVWTIKDNVAYQVTYAAISSQFDKYLPIVKRMMSSFKINR